MPMGFDCSPGCRAGRGIAATLEAVSFFLPLIFCLLFDYLYYNHIAWFAEQRGVDYSLTVASALDRMIPFMPLFILPYLSAWAIPAFVMIFLYRARVAHSGVRHMYVSLIVMYVLCGAIWWIFPVEMHVDINTLLPEPRGMLGSMILYTHQNSSMWNSLPSMHVSAPWFLYRFAAPYLRRLRVALFTLTLLICVSTVAVKMHYILDVVAGFLIAETCYSGVYKWLERRQLLAGVNHVIYTAVYLVALFLTLLSASLLHGLRL